MTLPRRPRPGRGQKGVEGCGGRLTKVVRGQSAASLVHGAHSVLLEERQILCPHIVPLLQHHHLGTAPALFTLGENVDSPGICVFGNLSFAWDIFAKIVSGRRRYPFKIYIYIYI